jgi:hypothetical protein
MATAAPASAGASCDQAAGRMIDLLTADKKDVPPEQVKKFHDLFVERCGKDAWSVELRQCLAGMKTLDDANACEPKMTDAQKDALNKAMGGDDEPPPPPPTAEPAPAAVAPPTPGAPANSTRAPSSSKPKKSGDPCDGGN